jgi:hypothetical protein
MISHEAISKIALVVRHLTEELQRSVEILQHFSTVITL